MDKNTAQIIVSMKNNDLNDRLDLMEAKKKRGEKEKRKRRKIFSVKKKRRMEWKSKVIQWPDKTRAFVLEIHGGWVGHTEVSIDRIGGGKTNRNEGGHRDREKTKVFFDLGR